MYFYSQIDRSTDPSPGRVMSVMTSPIPFNPAVVTDFLIIETPTPALHMLGWRYTGGAQVGVHAVSGGNWQNEHFEAPPTVNHTWNGSAWVVPAGVSQ